MILVDSLLYEIERRLNRLSSGFHQKIPLEDRILSLNQAQINLIKNKYYNDEGSSFDSTRKRYEDLQVLIEPHSKHNHKLELSNVQLNEYSFDLSLLAPKYLFFVDAYITADKGDCKDRIIWLNPSLTKHADLPNILTNEHLKPSFEFQETCMTISSNFLNVYTDGTFEPKEIYVSYIRYPKEIDKEGYIKIDGSPSVNQDCELPDYLFGELVDLAVEELSMFIENTAAIETSQIRIRNNNQ